MQNSKRLIYITFASFFIFNPLSLFTSSSAKSCTSFLDGHPTELKSLSIEGLEEYYVYTGFKLTKELEKLPSATVKDLLTAFNENDVTRIVLVYEGLSIKNNTFYFSPENSEIYFNGQLLKALQLRSGLKSLFPELNIAVNPIYVNGKIDVQALLSYFESKKDFILNFYKKSDQNIFSIGYFTDYIHGRLNLNSDIMTTHIEVNIHPGLLQSIRGLFINNLQPNIDFLDFQFQAIYERAKFGRDIYVTLGEPL